MSQISPEIKRQLIHSIENDDIEALKNTLDALEAIEHPEMIKVEFTKTQLNDLVFAKQKLRQPDIGAVLRMIVDGFMPNYKKSVRDAERKRI